MRKIQVVKWKVKSPTGEEVEDTTLSVLNAIINSTRPEDMPRGVDHFRLFKRLADAFDKAQSGTLILEDADYDLLKRLVNNGVPAIWGMSKDLTNAVESYLSAPQE
jgi:hypothetical protein